MRRCPFLPEDLGVPLDLLSPAIRQVTIKIRDYQQQTLSDGTDAKAISYVKLSIGDDMAWGVGEDTDTAKANFDAVLSAVTRIPGALDRLGGRVSSGDALQSK